MIHPNVTTVYKKECRALCVTMFGLVIVCVSLVDDYVWWWTIYKLRREAREAADRLVLTYERHYRKE